MKEISNREQRTEVILIDSAGNLFRVGVRSDKDIPEVIAEQEKTDRKVYAITDSQQSKKIVDDQNKTNNPLLDQLRRS